MIAWSNFACRVGRRRNKHDAGFSTVLLPMLVWCATLIAIVAIDITAYLAAASKAQSLADAAALAAVAPDIQPVQGRSPRAEAERIVAAGDGRLEGCVCVRGSEYAQVAASVKVHGLVIPNLGASRVTASAEAVVAPPEELAPGPTRDRARWRGHHYAPT